MKKVILGVVALCVAMSSVWAFDLGMKFDYCSGYKSRYAKCLKYMSGDHGNGNNSCRDERGYTTSLENLRMRLEACLVQYGR